jgi:FdhD protein
VNILGANQPIKYVLVETDRLESRDSDVIVEAPVSLTVNGEVWLTFMCTPIHLEELAVGFLFNEGVIQSIDQVANVRLCASGDNVDVWLNHAAEKPEKWFRTSGCTGGATSVEVTEDESISSIHLHNGSVLTSEQVSNLIVNLFEAQDIYKKSGGVHTSALSDGEKILVTADDIGRHNTLDKIAGICLLKKIEIPRKVVITTGRISSEMIQKAIRLSASIVISRTSPSSLSIQMAEKSGVTLIGYARRTNFRIYTHPQRIYHPERENQIKQEDAKDKKTRFTKAY